MVVADEELDAGEAAELQAGEERAPVDLGLAEGDADAENRALAPASDAHGDEDGAIDDVAAVADFFVPRVDKDVGSGAERAGAPQGKLGVQFGGAVADLSGADRRAAELLDDGGDLAGGNALNVHLGEGQLEGLFAADALVEGRRVELETAADLGDVEVDGADAGGEGLVLEAVGIAKARVGTLVGFGAKGGGTLAQHRLVDEEADALGKSTGTLFGEQLHNGGEQVRVLRVGHGWIGVGCFLTNTPT